MRLCYLTLILILVFSFAFSGCIVAEEYQPLSSWVTPGLGTDPVTGAVDNDLGESVKPTTAAQFIDSQEVQQAVQALECDKAVCQMEWPGWLARPFAYPDREWIDLTYPYASTGSGYLAIHHGVEFPNPFGAQVRAASAGEVVFAGSDDQIFLGPNENFYGNLVIIRHAGLFYGEDLYSLYGHLSSINVIEGDLVAAGDITGEVGASGVADGSHLHFEVRYKVNDYNHTTNPILWFSPLTIPGSRQTSALAGLITGRDGKPLPEASVTLQKLRGEGKVEKTYYFKTYAQNGVNPHPLLNENFSLVDIAPGDYRLTFVSGRLYEILFTLDSGTLVFIRIDME